MSAGNTAALGGQQFAVPGTYSLAGRIIHQWLHGDASPGGGSNGSEQSPTAGDSSESSGAGDLLAKNTALLDRVADVQIDSGTFKYVLLRISTPDGQTKACHFIIMLSLRAFPTISAVTAKAFRSTVTPFKYALLEVVTAGGQMKVLRFPSQSHTLGVGGLSFRQLNPPCCGCHCQIVGHTSGARQWIGKHKQARTGQQLHL